MACASRTGEGLVPFNSFSPPSTPMRLRVWIYEPTWAGPLPGMPQPPPPLLGLLKGRGRPWGLALCSHLDGGTDEASPAVHFQHPLKELVPLAFVIGEIPLRQVDGLGNATCEVHQRIRCVASIQGLVTARQPGEQRGESSQLMLPCWSKSFIL